MINLLQVEVFGIDTYRFFVIFINDIDKYLKLPLLYYNYWNLDRQLLKIFNENISISVDLLPLMKRTEYQYKPTEGEVKAINNFIDEQMKEVRINDLLIEHNKLEKKMKEIENENELLKSTLNIWKIDTDKEKGNVILRFMRRVIARKKLKEYPEWEHNLSEITNKN